MLSMFVGTWRGGLRRDMHRRSIVPGSRADCPGIADSVRGTIGVPDRRAVIAGVAAVLLAAPALSQTPRKRWRLGILNWSPQDNNTLLMKELAALGYAPDQGADYTVRHCASKPDTAAQAAQELVALNLDMIIATSTGPARAAKAATATIPILITAADPLHSGLVTSLAQPGGNLTGVSISAFDLIAKRVEIAAELVPGLTRIAFLGQRGEPNTEAFERAVRGAAARLSLAVDSVLAAAGEPLDQPIATAASRRAGVLIPQPIFIPDGREIAEAAIRHRLPVVGEGAVFASDGGLLGYGIDRGYTFSRLAVMIDRVLRGARPGDLPMEQGIRTILSVNLDAARAIGLSIPPSLLDRADEVIG